MISRYDCNSISEYIISRCNEINESITNLQLQKVLYYVQGYFLREYDECAFDSKIEAWQYGPVVPDSYYSYCINGREPLKNDYTDNDIMQIISKEERKLINEIINKCLGLSIGELISKTHNESPWSSVGIRDEISSAQIREYFECNDPLNIS